MGCLLTRDTVNAVTSAFEKLRTICACQFWQTGDNLHTVWGSEILCGHLRHLWRQIMSPDVPRTDNKPGLFLNQTFYHIKANGSRREVLFYSL